MYKIDILMVWSSMITCTLPAQLQPENKRNRPPNVILIYSDDHGTFDLNCYGAKDLHTPNLDQLASSGIQFTQFYASSPICSPSRASLLTGRYPQRAGLPGNAPSEFGSAGMPAGQLTLAELFKQGGYQTAHFGKWHLGYSPETMPNQQGFDYSYGFMGGCIDNYSHYYYWGGPNRHDLWRNGTQIWEPGEYFPKRITGEAIEYIERNQDNPFFIYWASNTPHYPLQPEPDWVRYYQHLPMPRRLYAASLSSMDEKIGQILGKLKELGLAENTIVIFQGDQGHSEEERAFGSGGFSGPFRGSKFSLLEAGIRVPAIISWPSTIPAGQYRDQFATNIDWFPTLASFCSLPQPDRKIDGKNLRNIIDSETAGSPHPYFFWQSLGSAEHPQWAVRKGPWKLMHRPIGLSITELFKERFFLVNLETDSAEQFNLADRYPSMVDSLEKNYEAWIGEVESQ